MKENVSGCFLGLPWICISMDKSMDLWIYPCVDISFRLRYGYIHGCFKVI